MNPIDILPFDAWKSIFAKVDLKTLGRLSRTCSTFHHNIVLIKNFPVDHSHFPKEVKRHIMHQWNMMEARGKNSHPFIILLLIQVPPKKLILSRARRWVVKLNPKPGSKVDSFDEVIKRISYYIKKDNRSFRHYRINTCVSRVCFVASLALVSFLVFSICNINLNERDDICYLNATMRLDHNAHLFKTSLIRSL